MSGRGDKILSSSASVRFSELLGSSSYPLPESSQPLSLQEKGWEAPVLETFKYVLLMF